MYALPDPSDPDQAVLINVPVMVDWLNYGDIVRLAPEDDFGVRRIVEVVVASGHQHMLVAVEEGEAADLVNELERMFPSWALRIAGASADHPLGQRPPAPRRRRGRSVIAGWLAEDDDDSRTTPRDDVSVPVRARARRLGLTTPATRYRHIGVTTPRPKA